MRYSDECFLGSVVETKNDIGDLIKTIVYSDFIFCNVKSIRQSEFYQAQAVGMKPELTLEVHQCDYQGEVFVMFNNQQYRVLRTYLVDTEFIELVLYREINNASSEIDYQI